MRTRPERVSAPRANTRDSTRITFPSSTASGSPKASDSTAAAVYGPTPGSARNAVGSGGTVPPWSLTTA